MMTWPSRQFAVAHRPQFAAQRLLGDRDAELREYPLRQIDQPPTDHAVDRRDWTSLDQLRDRLALRVVELGRLPRRLAIQQTPGP